MSYSLIGIYLLFLIVVIFFSGNGREKNILLIPVTILSAFVGLRGAVSGYDYHVYGYFYNLGYGENPYGYEKLFLYLKDLFRFLGADYNIFILALGMFFVFGTYYIFIKYSANPTICFFIYLSTFFFWHNYNILRNFIGIIIFYMALDFVLKKKIWKYMLAVVVAFNFHKTAIILFPLYFLLRTKLKLKVMGAVTVAALLINPLSDLVFKLNIGFLGLGERIGRYTGIKEMGNSQEFGELIVLVVGMALVLLYNGKREEELGERENLFYNLTFYSFIFFVIFYRYAIMLRFMEYFRFAGIITAVYLMNRIRGKNLKYIALFSLMIYLTFRYYNSVFDYGMADYKTWLF